MLLAKNISASVESSPSLKFFKRTLYGLQDAKIIQSWLEQNREQLRSADSAGNVFQIVWPLLQSFMRNGDASKLNKPDLLKLVADAWMDGAPFNEILAMTKKMDIRLKWGEKQFRALKIEQVVGICESCFAFDGALLMGALINILEQEGTENDECVDRLQISLKRLKYGLLDEKAISFYELAFPDRVVAQELASMKIPFSDEKHMLAEIISENKKSIRGVLSKFPSFFENRLDDVISFT